MTHKNILRCLLFAVFFSSVVMAEDGFIVEEIKITGLQRITAGTVFSYLPVNVGEKFLYSNVPTAMRALFKTGFFRDISLEKDGNILIVHIKERASIAKIVIEGNKDIGTEDLTKALKKTGLSEGKVFNRQILEKVEQELRRQYFSRGKYGLKIKTEVAKLTRNRVGISIKISEGRIAKIKQVSLVGNQVFETDDLLKEFELSPSNILSFYFKNDQYSKQKLSADLEQLRSYYLDRGYINFAIESTQVAITPNKKGIYITVNMKEGDQFTLEKVKIAGNLVVDPEELIKLVQIGPEEVFSRRRATETSKQITDRLGDDGYAFANVNMVPDINNEAKTVDMTFFVDPGKRVYVRRINMRGNTKSRDVVLRREMRQMESSWSSTSKIERSKTRLNRLGYFEEVNVETPPVVGTSDQIDVNYTVTERASGNLTAGIGFSQTQGVIYNASISQDNIFGSGKRVSFNFNNSDVSTIYSFGFLNPYFTLDGVSLGYNLLFRETDAAANNLSNYSTDVISAGGTLGFPLDEFERINLGLDIKHTTLNTSEASAQEIIDGVAEFGSSFLTVPLSIGWVHDTLDRAIFPTSGGQQRISGLVAIPGLDLSYYKISAKDQHYFPLAKDLVLKLLIEGAYGDAISGSPNLPFFENFFGGGVNSVRGFEDNTLGPTDSNGDPLGGNIKLIGSAELFIPVPFFEELKSVRLGAFFDAGMISNSFNLGDLRYSVGISGKWLSPFGALAVSAAVPLSKKSTDRTQVFQFTFGSGF